MSDERLQILQMLQAGTISPEEALRLLEAVAPPDTEARSPGPRQVRLQVLPRSGHEGEVKEVNIRLPFQVFESVGRLFLATVPAAAGVSWPEMEKAVASGMTGKVLETETATQRLILYVE